MSLKVIDVSSYNGTVDWAICKKNGVDGAILKIVMKTLKKDAQFDNNYKGVIKQRIPWGVYNYSYATTVQKVKADMKVVCDILDKLDTSQLKYGIWLDIEDSCQAKMSKTKLAEMCNAAKEYVENRGYAFGIYTGMSFLSEHFDLTKHITNNWWIARYYKHSTPMKISTNPNNKYKPLRPKDGFIGWQYTSHGRIVNSASTGNSHNFDISVMYNGMKKPVKLSEKKVEKKVETPKTTTQKTTVSASTKTVKKVLDQAKSWLGRKESDGTHKLIIDTYNSHKPLPRGYKVTYKDSWCATFVSACFIKCGMENLIPVECSCPKMIEGAKKMGIWNESDSRTPKSGDILLYDWQDTGKGDNTGNPDHVGIVEKVSNGIITVIEGNYNDSVKRRELKVNDKCIRGYIIPKYDKETSSTVITTKKSYTGTYPSKFPKRGYYKIGDGYEQNESYKDQIRLVQRLLNFVTGSKLTDDGKYGKKTKEACSKAQTKFGVPVNGCFGKLTLSKCKSFKK